jgi:hypothetical protein
MPFEPPSDISASAKRFWVATVGELHLTQAHQFATLEICVRCLDEIAACRKLIKKDGLTLRTQYSKKAHPALATLRTAEASFTRSLRQIKPKREELREHARRAKFSVMQFPRKA